MFFVCPLCWIYPAFPSSPFRGIGTGLPTPYTLHLTPYTLHPPSSVRWTPDSGLRTPHPFPSLPSLRSLESLETLLSLRTLETLKKSHIPLHQFAYTNYFYYYFCSHNSADSHDRYTIHIRYIYDRYTIHYAIFILSL